MNKKSPYELSGLSIYELLHKQEMEQFQKYVEKLDRAGGYPDPRRKTQTKDKNDKSRKN